MKGGQKQELRAIFKDKILKAHELIDLIHGTNDDNAEILLELMQDDDLMDKYGDMLEAMRENIDKIHNLL